MHSTPTLTHLKIRHDEKTYETNIEGPISHVEVDGQSLQTLHDVCMKIEKVSCFTKYLAITCFILAITILGVVSYHVSSDKEQFAELNKNHDNQLNVFQDEIKLLKARMKLKDNQNLTYANKLVDIGWTWKSGGWVFNESP